MATQTFRANSLYDPDYSGGGNQPLFFQTLCGATDGTQPYTNYRVCGAKVKAYFINDNTGTATVGLFFIHWRYGGAGTLDTISDVGTQPNTRQTDVGVANSNKGIRMLQTYISMKKMMGLKDIKDDDNTSASYLTNPYKQVYLDVGYVPYSSGVSTDIFLRVKITFYCQFFSQNEIDES